MSKYRQWVLTLGLMAATPGAAMAAPKLPFLSSIKRTQSARPAAGLNNQRIADRIAAALREANISGYDIAIEQRDGTAVLSGKVTDVRLKSKASTIVGRVPGVVRVDNQLEVIGNGGGLPDFGQVDNAGSEPPALAAEFKAPLQSRPPVGNIQPVSATQTPTQVNQAVAQRIADSLAKAGLSGYDVEVRYANGTALLAGQVRSPGQRAKAQQAASSVAGVDNVENRLLVMAPQQRQAAPARNPFAQAAYQGGQQPPPMRAGGPPPMQRGGPSTMPMAQSYGHGGGAAQAVYNSPNLPENAWPSYASYPNYSQVAYPKQYSASAWPYIGPFYPYPQVPLGWRQVQLEWDDGSWNLNFRPRTDKWWWFLNPKNW